MEKVPRLPRPATFRRIDTAVRAGPLRTPCGVEKVPSPAAPRDPDMDRDRAERPPLAHPLWRRETAAPAASRESYAHVLCGVRVTWVPRSHVRAKFVLHVCGVCVRVI